MYQGGVIVTVLSKEAMATMFAAGAYSIVGKECMSDREKDDAVLGICKQAASGRRRPGERETLWDRHKSWIIPSLIGSLAFYLGSEGGQKGNPAKSHISNAWDIVKNKAKALLGLNDKGPTTNALTKIVERYPDAASEKGTAPEPRGSKPALPPNVGGALEASGHGEGAKPSSADDNMSMWYMT
jgi:hypothetical protein